MAREVLPIQLDSLGALTTKTVRPLNGWVHSIRVAGTALTPGGTADFVFTRDDGGTVLTVANQTAPFQYQPRETLHTNAGGSALAASSEGIPVDGHLNLTVAQGAPNAVGTVYIFYKEEPV